MRLLVMLVRSMGMRRGVRAWCVTLGLRSEAAIRRSVEEQRPVVHHGERPKLPGWRR